MFSQPRHHLAKLWILSVICLRLPTSQFVEGLVKKNTSTSAKATNYHGPDVLLTVLNDVVGNCDAFLLNLSNSASSNFTGIADQSRIQVAVFPPSKYEITLYANMVDTLSRANPELAIGNVLGNSRVPAWLKSGNNWQLPASHPRNNKLLCLNASSAAGVSTMNFYKEMKEDASEFYLLHTRDALIHGTGIVALKCGYVQAHQACETIFKFLGKKWYGSCKNGIAGTKNVSWKTVWNGSNESVNALLAACPEKHEKSATTLKRHKRVFVISAGWDSNYHHFMLDSLTRLVRHLAFLKANPDIMIHIRASEQGYKKQTNIINGRALRARMFGMLGIDMTRIISGQIYADEVFLPKAVECNAPMTIAYELSGGSLSSNPESPIHGPNSLILAAAEKNATLAAEMKVKTVVIQHRPCYTKEDCDKNWRSWDNYTMNAVKEAFIRAFPSHNIIVINSDDPYWTNCLSCQVRLYARTDILVGLHGAGLTNVVYMPPGSLLVELAGQFDGRMQPVCGYHGPLAAVFGVHHYIHYYDWKLNFSKRRRNALSPLLDPIAIADETYAFAKELNMKVD